MLGAWSGLGRILNSEPEPESTFVKSVLNNVLQLYHSQRCKLYFIRWMFEMKIFPRTHTRPWLCENGPILRSHQMNANFFYLLLLLLPSFPPVQLLKWVHIHTFNSNGYVRLVVNWSFAIAYIVMNIRWENVFHLFLRTGQNISIAVVSRQNKPLTMASNTKSIYTVHTTLGNDTDVPNPIFARALSVCLFV